VFSRSHRRARILFGLSDVLLTTCAFEAAYQTRVWLKLQNVFYLTIDRKALLLGFSVLVWLLIGLWLQVYERLDSAHPRTILRDTLRQCALGATAVVLFEYLLRLDLSRPFLVLFTAYTWVFLCVFRLKAGALVGLIRSEYGGPHYVLVVGVGESAQRLGRSVEQSARYGIRLVGFLAEDARTPPGLIRLETDHQVHPLDHLVPLLRKHVIDEIIFAVDSHRLAELEEVFLRCDEEGVRTRVAIDFFPHVRSDVYLDHLGQLPLLTFSAAPHDDVRLLVKRTTDICLAAAALLVLSPLMLLVAVLVKLTSPGPAIFRQVRCGLNGRRFIFYKFRSMCDNADQLRPAFEDRTSGRWPAIKLAKDPRLTPIGAYLRKYSIDEWPQLWNVVKGEMSLVGPRPAVPQEIDHYKDWQRRRLRMRPGLTCLWALEGRDTLDFDTWMKKDMEYIDNWSLALDIKILLRTIPRVLSGKGAY
jgi:exopolysaccharide biosynthesis polyprenyl glycosylphosphotransferase